MALTMPIAADPGGRMAPNERTGRQAVRAAGLAAICLLHGFLIFLLVRDAGSLSLPVAARIARLNVAPDTPRPAAPAPLSLGRVVTAPTARPITLAPPVITIAPEAPAAPARICPAWPDPNTPNPACPPILVLPDVFSPQRLPDQTPEQIEAAHKARMKELARRFGPKETAPAPAWAADRVPITGGDAWQKMERWKDQNMSGPGVGSVIDGKDPE